MKTNSRGMLAGPLWAHAQVPSTPQPIVEQQRQQERERALREQNERTVDQRPQAAPPAPTQLIREFESPCFRIDRVLLVGEQSEAWLAALQDLSTDTLTLSLIPGRVWPVKRAEPDELLASVYRRPEMDEGITMPGLYRQFLAM